MCCQGCLKEWAARSNNTDNIANLFPSFLWFIFEACAPVAGAGRFDSVNERSHIRADAKFPILHRLCASLWFAWEVHCVDCGNLGCLFSGAAAGATAAAGLFAILISSLAAFASLRKAKRSSAILSTSSFFLAQGTMLVEHSSAETSLERTSIVAWFKRLLGRLLAKTCLVVCPFMRLSLGQIGLIADCNLYMSSGVGCIVAWVICERRPALWCAEPEPCGELGVVFFL